MTTQTIHQTYSNGNIPGKIKLDADHEKTSQTPVSRPFSHRKIAVTLLFADVLGFTVFYFMTLWFWKATSHANIKVYLPPLIITLCANFIIFYIFDLYRPASVILGVRAPVRTVIAAALSTGLVMLQTYASLTTLKFSAVYPLIAFVPFIGYAAAWRFFIHRWVHTQLDRMKWLVIGDHDCFVHFWEEYKNQESRGEIVYLSQPGEETNCDPNWPCHGTYADLDVWLRQDWSGVVLASNLQLPSASIEKLMRLRLQGTRIYDLIDYYERFWFKIPVFHVKNGWFAISHGFDLLHNPMTLRLKRLVDLTLALGLLCIFIPLFPLIALLIKIDSRGTIFYKQKRTGENGKSFELYKFRTMVADAEKAGAQWAQQCDHRITRVGKFLRLSRLDETPQLWNVFCGDMSFIGPRPERPIFNSQLEKEIPFYDLRHLVKPGITGWAQVLYKYGASVADAKEKLQYDLYYIKNCSFLLDIAIVFKTMRVVLLGKGR